MTEETIFVAALEKANPADRAAYLEVACTGNSELRRRVEALLRAHEQSGDLFDSPAHGSGPRTEQAADAASGPDGHSRSARLIAEIPGGRIGPYTLSRKIGEGGMGVVFLAQQEAPVCREVALKVIKPGMDSAQVIARLEAERQALALMDHVNIARFLDAGTTDLGHPFFVMEPVHGLPITEHCDRNRLTPRERLELFVPVCQAIQHAHQKGIIHRDVKPSNVLVTLQDGKLVPKVIDFGVAKAIDRRLTERSLFTQFGVIVGTPEYMSPEQARLSGLDVDTRSDIYSLGVLLYELLTGGTPLERGRLRQAAFTEVLRRVREEEPPRPSSRLGPTQEMASIAASRATEPSKLAKLVRGDLDWIVMKALEKDPSRRYETASGLARDVRRHLEGDPVEAGPRAAMYRLRKFARKHRAALGTAAAFAGLLVLAVVVSTWQAIRARKAETEAHRDRDAALTARLAESEARRRAEDAERASRTEAQKARAINRFLTHDLLSQAEPEHNAANSKVTLLEVLDRAAGRVGDRFRDQPEVEAAVRRTIAGTYHALGVNDRSERHWRAVVELERRRSGPDSPEAWMSLAQVGHALGHLGRSAEALETLVRSRDALARLRGPDHAATLAAMDHLATAYRDAGRYDEAIPLLEEALRLLKAKPEGDDHATLFAMNNLALTYYGAHRIAEAIPLLEEGLRLDKAQLGPDHPLTLTAMNNLALADLSSRRLPEAVALFEEGLRLRKGRLGPDHPNVLVAMNNLASAYKESGRLDRAVPLFEQTLELHRTKRGSRHPATLLAMNNLGAAYEASGRPGDALALYEECFRLSKAALGPDHPNTLAAMNSLAGTYLETNRLGEAIPLCEGLVRLKAAKLGPDHSDALSSMNNLLVAYLKARRWAEAEATARQCLEVRTRKQPDGWLRFHTMSLLGAALAGQKKYAEAEPLLIAGYAGLKARAARIPAPTASHVAAAAARIVLLYEAWSKPDKAVEWRTKLGQSAATKPKT